MYQNKYLGSLNFLLNGGSMVDKQKMTSNFSKFRKSNFTLNEFETQQENMQKEKEKAFIILNERVKQAFGYERIEGSLLEVQTGKAFCLRGTFLWGVDSLSPGEIVTKQVLNSKNCKTSNSQKH